MRRGQLWVSVLLLVLLLVGCAPKAAPAPAPQAPAPVAAPVPVAAAPVAPAKPAWQVEWEKTLDGAKKEGTVALHIVAGGDVRRAILQIASMQGIKAEAVVARDAEFLAKIGTERRAGIYSTDLHIAGIGPILTTMKPTGIVEPLDSALILPHLTDPETIKKVWYQGTLPWGDQGHVSFLIALQPGTAITINTDLVKADEIKSWRNLLEPKWRGKLGYNDPTTPGYGSLSVQVMLELMGEDYVKELVKAQPIIIRDQRQLVDWLAHGKLAIAIAAPVEIIVEFLRVAAPIKVVIPQEGTWLGAGNIGAMSWLKNAPHPNASKVFINWITSKEAQDILGPAGGVHCTREDISTAHLLPGLSRTKGVKYFPAYNEENSLKRGQVTDKWAKEIFGPMVR